MFLSCKTEQGILFTAYFKIHKLSDELIFRTGWTTQQNVLFDKILKIVSAYRLSWLTYKGVSFSHNLAFAIFTIPCVI